MPMAMIRVVITVTGSAAVLWKNGILRVRSMCTTRVCDSKPSMNQPDWNRDCISTLLAANTYHIRAKVVMSKIDEVGPIQIMKRPMFLASHLRGLLRYSLSILSHGRASWDMSYIRFFISKWIASIGMNCFIDLATTTENTLPKLELAVMFRYFMMLPNVSRPLSTPS